MYHCLVVIRAYIMLFLYYATYLRNSICQNVVKTIVFINYCITKISIGEVITKSQELVVQNLTEWGNLNLY